MGFWEFVLVLVLGVATIEAIKDVAKSRAIRSKDLEALHQELASVRKDLEEIKEYVADLVIHSDR